MVHRSDISGTTLNLLEYLKATAGKDWPYQLSENWPNDVGLGAKGTSGVISTIDQANGTIGYADHSQAGDMGTVAVKVGGEYTEISTIDQANGTIGYADLSQAGDMGTVAVKVGGEYTEISADAASKAVADSNLDESVPGANRVVLDINHATTEPGAYPIVLVSYDIACPIYRDENTARFAKSWLGYITGNAGQDQAGKAGQDKAKNATGSAPLPENIAKYVRASIDAIEVK